MKVLAEHHANPKSGMFGKSGELLIDRAVSAYQGHHPDSMPGNAGTILPRLAQLVEHDGKQYVILWRPGLRGHDPARVPGPAVRRHPPRDEAPAARAARAARRVAAPPGPGSLSVATIAAATVRSLDMSYLS